MRVARPESISSSEGMPFTAAEFHLTLDSDLWVINQLLTLPEDPSPVIEEQGDTVRIQFTDSVCMPQIQQAIERYRSKILPTIFFVTQKVYAELFRLVLGNHSVSASNRSAD